MTYDDFLKNVAVTAQIFKADFQQGVKAIKRMEFPVRSVALDNELEKAGLSENHIMMMKMLLMPEGRSDGFKIVGEDIYLSKDFDNLVRYIESVLA